MRCKACDIKLDEIDLKRKSLDRDICSNCRFLGNQEFNSTDLHCSHTNVTDIPLDGTSLQLEEYYGYD